MPAFGRHGAVLEQESDGSRVPAGRSTVDRVQLRAVLRFRAGIRPAVQQQTYWAASRRQSAESYDPRSSCCGR